MQVVTNLSLVSCVYRGTLVQPVAHFLQLSTGPGLLNDPAGSSEVASSTRRQADQTNLRTLLPKLLNENGDVSA